MSNNDEPYNDNDNYSDDDKYYPHNNSHKKYFKFDDKAWEMWGKWLYDAMNDIVESSSHTWYVYGFKPKKFPVNDWMPDTMEDKYFMCLGNNQYNEPIWKTKYLVKDKLNVFYKNHMMSHASYILKEPLFYKSLFDNLN
jgi:hypothetical protein